MLEYSPSIQSTLKNLPNQPGVYRFYDQTETLLYVGKAKNLKNRVTTYFQNNRQKNNPRLTLMVSQISRIDYTIVSTESESLILEANLINSLQPKYNIQLKDDRSYLYVRVTNTAIPFITFTRSKYDKSSTYYGPYTKKYDITNVLRFLRLIFPYCEKKSLSELGNFDKSCQYVQLRQCDGICCGKETIEEYSAKISQIKNVLSGNTSGVVSWLNTKIQDAISLENYELASLYRDRLSMLQRVIGDQKIILAQPVNLDIITLVIDNIVGVAPLASVFVQTIREGKMINVNNFILSGGVGEQESELEDEEEAKDKIQESTDKSSQSYEFLRTFMTSYYSNKNENNQGLEVLVQCYEGDKG